MPSGNAILRGRDSEPENLCLCKTAWWGWEDSKLQPNDYQPRALNTKQKQTDNFCVAGLGGLEPPTKRRRFSTPLVRVGPGSTALTVTPVAANARISAKSADLEKP
jgi:hypothetical protein